MKLHELLYVVSIPGSLICLGFAVWFFVSGIRKRRDEAWKRRYRHIQGEGTGSVSGQDDLATGLSRILETGSVRNAMSLIGWRSHERESELSREITDTGKPYDLRGEPGTVWVLGGALAGVGLFWFADLVFQFGEPGTVTWTLCLVSLLLLGAFTPRYGVQYLRKRRLDALERVAPDVIDLLVLGVEAGLTIDAGLVQAQSHIARYSRQMKAELDTFMAELSVLPNRKEAFNNLVERTGSDTFRYLAIALQQGEKYGTPVAASLKLVTEESRKRSHIALEKKAARLPVWLSLPLMLLVLPPVIAISAGPGFVSLIRSIGGGV